MYLIAFNFTTKQYLRFDFKDLSCDQKHFFLSSFLSLILYDPSSLNPHVNSTSSSQLLEVCQLHTFLTFSSDLLSHVVSLYNTLRNILPFTLSIPVQPSFSFLYYQIDYFTILKALYPTAQSARWEEDLISNPIMLSTEMAPRGSRPYCFPQ